MANRKTTSGMSTAPDTLDPDDPARQAEIGELQRRKKLALEQLSRADAAADDLVILRSEVHALEQAAARAGQTIGPKYMSEGTREEIERQGWSTDPFTGRKLTRDDLP
jgi:carbamate kinase